MNGLSGGAQRNFWRVIKGGMASLSVSYCLVWSAEGTSDLDGSSCDLSSHAWLLLFTLSFARVAGHMPVSDSAR